MIVIFLNLLKAIFWIKLLKKLNFLRLKYACWIRSKITFFRSLLRCTANYLRTHYDSQFCLFQRIIFLVFHRAIAVKFCLNAFFKTRPRDQKFKNNWNFPPQDCSFWEKNINFIWYFWRCLLSKNLRLIIIKK